MNLGHAYLIGKIEASGLPSGKKVVLSGEVSRLAAQYNGEGIPPNALRKMNSFVDRVISEKKMD